MAVEHRSVTLSSGIRVHADIDDSAVTAAMGIFVDTGGRDEPSSLMGVSHFLEHMLFKGSASRTAEEVNREFDAIGANHNAFTSLEMTAYYAACLPEHFQRATQLVADLFRPALRDADVEEERGVILEEIAMYDDDPSSVLYDALMEAAFPGQSIGHRVLGVPATVRALSPTELRTYFHDRYAATNTVFAAAGRVDMDRFARAVEDETADWPRHLVGRTASRGTRATMEAGRLPMSTSKAHRGYLQSIWPSPDQQDDDRYAIALACYILGGADHSRLEWSLVDRGIAEAVSCGAMPMDGIGLGMVGAVCDPDRLGGVESIIDAEAARLPDTLTEEELAQAKAKLRTAMVFAGERPAGRMQGIGRSVITLGRHVPIEETLARYAALTCDDIKAALARWPCRARYVGTMVPAAAAAPEGSLS